jgi:hypothetical protein
MVYVWTAGSQSKKSFVYTVDIGGLNVYNVYVGRNTQPQETRAMASPIGTLKSFDLSCPFCGHAEPALRIDLNDLAEITCSECDESFTVQKAVTKAAENLRRWQAVAKWIRMAGEVLATPSTTE